MLDHIGIEIPASKFAATVTWYEAALAPLGYTKAFTLSGGSLVGFRDCNGRVDWWMSRCDDAEVTKPDIAVHVAFCAKDRRIVDAFHVKGIKAGGKDAGEPGVRAVYHANYYAAFVLDPVGNKIEAVSHGPR